MPCRHETWTIKELSNAIQHKKQDKKEIVVPMFQRGTRWKDEQEITFIDSVKKGYPVGTLLFYKKIENKIERYILVDGLQRGNTIKKYVSNPAKFILSSGIEDKLIKAILDALDIDCIDKNIEEIKKIITQYFIDKDSLNTQYYELGRNIIDYFNQDLNKVGDIIDLISKYFSKKNELFNSICNESIHVIVYEGDEDTLPVIFERINSKGTPLSKYEIYAASWPHHPKLKVENKNIIEHVVNKYKSTINNGYQVDQFDELEFRANKEVSAFEYLFGLSKYLEDKYSILNFDKKKQNNDDKVNSLGFELVNACLNSSDKIKKLYEDILKIDVNFFESLLCDAIDYVNSILSKVTEFKGNNRKVKNNNFHAQYQIISIISCVFKEMFDKDNNFKIKDSWAVKKDILEKNIINYYVYDILKQTWGEGGNKKIHDMVKNDRYLQPLERKNLESALDSFFEYSLSRNESKSVQNPKSAEYVLLNCIYLQQFTANDQLSSSRFDVEHIAPKNQLKQMILDCKGDGLPISSIANLCYLPEYENRSKKHNNFYQDNGYLQKVDIDLIENKYSFTSKNDLEWMDEPYTDYNKLKEAYLKFLRKRFNILKEKIFIFLEY